MLTAHVHAHPEQLMQAPAPVAVAAVLSCAAEWLLELVPVQQPQQPHVHLQHHGWALPAQPPSPCLPQQLAVLAAAAVAAAQAQLLQAFGAWVQVQLWAQVQVWVQVLCH